MRISLRKTVSNREIDLLLPSAMSLLSNTRGGPAPPQRAFAWDSRIHADTSCSAAHSTSPAVVSRPSDKRIGPTAFSAATPIASNDAQGLLESEWHADPVDAARSGISRSKRSPGMPGKLTNKVFGSRSVG